MSEIGTVESVWRYPVKSMRAEERDEIFVGYPGIYGDRLFAFRNASGRAGFPWFTARDQRQMLLYRPRFRFPEKSTAPANLAEAELLLPGATPVYGAPAELMIDVETPDGETFAIDDPSLADRLRDDLKEDRELTLLRSDRAMTDARPVSLISVQTIRQLSEETGNLINKLSFRANIYLDFASGEGFAEDQLVGRSLRLGEKVVLSIVERDPRCALITYDPETADKSPAVLKSVAQKHGGNAGVYAAVLTEGMVRRGDAVELLG